MKRVSQEAVWALARDRGYFVLRKVVRGKATWSVAERLDGEWKEIGRTNAEAFAWIEGMQP